MAVISCDLLALNSANDCNDRGGIRKAFWTEYNNIDWDTMLADPLLFDPTNEQILGYAMNGGAVFTEIEGESKNSFYEFTYTSEQDFYQLLVTFLFKGKDRTRRNRLQKAIACCNVVIHIYGRSGEQRVIGVDYNGEVFDPIVEFARVTRHLDSGGQLGTSRSRDELDLGGQSFYAPLWANVAESDIPLT